MSRTYGLSTMKDKHFRHNPNTIQKIDGKWINVRYASNAEHRTSNGRKVIDIFGRFK